MKSLTKLVLRKSVIVVLACVCGVTAVYFGGQKAEEAVQTLATRPPYEPPTIVLDAGHGGMDGGCTSVNGVSEKGINLEILLHLRAMLQMEGYTVVVTRDTDRSIHEEGIEGIANQKSSDMDHRLALFNEYDPAVCASDSPESIHGCCLQWSTDVLFQHQSGQQHPCTSLAGCICCPASAGEQTGN